jgi:hypothetical protein
MGHVCRCAAHVKADYAVETGKARRFGHGDDAPGRAGQDRVAGVKPIRRRHAAGRGHEHQAGAIAAVGGKARNERSDVAIKNGRKVGVGNGRVAASDQLHKWRDFMADRDLREAQSARDCGGADFMFREGPGMHENDRDRCDAVGSRANQILLKCGFIERNVDDAVGQNALADFDDPIVEHIGLDDGFGKDVGAGLGSDFQRIGKAMCDDKCGWNAFALQESIGRNRRAHFDDIDAVCRKRRGRRLLQELADDMKCRVSVGGRVDGQHFANVELADGITGHDIRECAAAIDEEAPLLVRRCVVTSRRCVVTCRRCGLHGRPRRCGLRVVVTVSIVGHVRDWAQLNDRVRWRKPICGAKTGGCPSVAA